MGSRWTVFLLVALLAGCLRAPLDASEPHGPPPVPVDASHCALVWLEDDANVPLARVTPMLPPNATAARSDSGRAIVTLAALACDEGQPAGLSWAWLSVRANVAGRSSEHVLEHWANASAWSAALAPHGAATPVDALAVELAARKVSLDATNETTRLRIAMPRSAATGSLPDAIHLDFDTGSTLDLRIDATPHASSAAFELPAGSRARELLGANGARGALYAEDAAVEGTLTRP